MERYNKNLRAALIAFHSEDQSNWDSQLFWLQYAFNAARNEATKCSPLSLVLSFRTNTPLSNLWELNDLLPEPKNAHRVKDLWMRAAANLKLSHKIMARRYNQGRKKVEFRVGDRVFVKNFPRSVAANKFAAKLAVRFNGPFLVNRYLTPVTIEILDPQTGKTSRYHVSHLKK